MKKSDICFIIAVASGISFAIIKNPILIIPFLGFGVGMLYFRKKED